jgi:hypothetical protein
VSTQDHTGGTPAAYTFAQRKAIAVASVRLRLLRRYDTLHSHELAGALVELAAAQVSLQDALDLVDAIFDDPRVPAAVIGSAFRLAREIVGSSHAQH